MLTTALYRHYYKLGVPLNIYDNYTPPKEGEYTFYPYWMIKFDEYHHAKGVSICRAVKSRVWHPDPNDQDAPVYNARDLHPAMSALEGMSYPLNLWSNTTGQNSPQYFIEIEETGDVIPLRYDFVYTPKDQARSTDLYYGEIDEQPAVYCVSNNSHLLMLYSPKHDFALDAFTVRRTKAVKVSIDDIEPCLKPYL